MSKWDVTEKEEVTVISTEKAKRPCKCSKTQATMTTASRIKRVFHRKEVLSDGWTRWTCLKGNCGQVKFSMGMTFEEEEVDG